MIPAAIKRANILFLVQLSIHFSPTSISITRQRLPALTLLFVDSDDDHTLVAAYADELVDGADTSTGQLAQEDHALDVVVLQKADVGAHLSDGPHVHHHNIIHLWEPVLVKSTAEPRHHFEDTNGKSWSKYLQEHIHRWTFFLGEKYSTAGEDSAHYCLLNPQQHDTEDGISFEQKATVTRRARS